MLSTEELKTYVYNEIQARLGEPPSDMVFFAEGTKNSREGTYIFNKNDKYHILYTEKGVIQEEIVTKDEREVLWRAVLAFYPQFLIDYAGRNREKGKDWRRALFEKEKEIFSLFGSDFEKRINDKINHILKEHPYRDEFSPDA